MKNKKDWEGINLYWLLSSDVPPSVVGSSVVVPVSAVGSSVVGSVVVVGAVGSVVVVGAVGDGCGAVKGSVAVVVGSGVVVVRAVVGSCWAVVRVGVGEDRSTFTSVYDVCVGLRTSCVQVCEPSDRTDAHTCAF